MDGDEPVVGPRRALALETPCLGGEDIAWVAVDEEDLTARKGLEKARDLEAGARALLAPARGVIGQDVPEKALIDDSVARCGTRPPDRCHDRRLVAWNAAASARGDLRERVADERGQSLAVERVVPPVVPPPEARLGDWKGDRRVPVEEALEEGRPRPDQPDHEDRPRVGVGP